jgi:hypothetical protein
MPAKRKKRLIVKQGVLKALLVEAVDRRALRTLTWYSFASIRVIRGQVDRWCGDSSCVRLLPLANA